MLYKLANKFLEDSKILQFFGITIESHQYQYRTYIVGVDSVIILLIALSCQKRTLDLIMNGVRVLITLNLATEVSEPLGDYGLQLTNTLFLN